MFGLSELKQTKFYQEAFQEGEQSGEQREARSLILRQLTRRLGTLPVKIDTQIQALALPQLEALGEALLDFTKLSDLRNWLKSTNH